MTDERPVDHPDLARHPAAPTALARLDGVLYRVPIVDRRDEAVQVRVEDVMAARAAVHLLSDLLPEFNAEQVETIGRATTLGTRAGETPPVNEEDVRTALVDLRDRLKSSLPDF